MINYWGQINLSCQWKVCPKAAMLKPSTTSRLQTDIRILWGTRIGTSRSGFVMLVGRRGRMMYLGSQENLFLIIRHSATS